MKDSNDNTTLYLNKMTKHAKSFIMPYEMIYYYKDLRTWTQKYLDLVITGITTILLAGLLLYAYTKNKSENGTPPAHFFLVGVMVILIVGICIIIALYLSKKVRELILTSERILYVSGKKGHNSEKTVEETPYDKINGMSFTNIRNHGPMVKGIMMIIVGAGILYLTKKVAEIEGNIPYIIFGIILLIALLMMSLLGFSYSYVFKLSGGNIEITGVSGRKNRKNANVINWIVMDMRKFGEWKSGISSKLKTNLPLMPIKSKKNKEKKKGKSNKPSNKNHRKNSKEKTTSISSDENKPQIDTAFKKPASQKESQTVGVFNSPPLPPPPLQTPPKFGVPNAPHATIKNENINDLDVDDELFNEDMDDSLLEEDFDDDLLDGDIDDSLLEEDFDDDLLDGDIDDLEI